MIPIKKISKKYWYVLVFFILSASIVIIWFHNTSLLATGEEGIPFYNPERTFALYSSFWYETSTGYLMPVLLPRAQMFLIISFLSFIPELLRFSQFIIFFFLIFSTFLSTYLLTKRIFQENKRLAITASLFYFFNLYSLSQIWERFLLTNIFAWSFLPLFVYLWIEIFEKRKVRYIFLFILAALVYCYAFGMPAMIITIWLPSCILILFYSINLRSNKKEVITLVSLYFLGSFLWICSNLWWVYPYLHLSNESFSLLTNWKADFDSLAGVSQYFPSQDILLLRQSYLFGIVNPWHSFYANPLVYVLSILIVVITIVGLVVSKKEKYWSFLFVFLLTGWFISKGTNFPFGDVFFSFIFSHFSFTTAFRNSYEKAGIIFLLPYSLFFGYGVYFLCEKMRWKNTSLITIITFSCLVLVWPMWTQSLFKTIHVVVPNYYKSTNEFINKTMTDGRILQLPMNPGDGVHYNWGGFGYGGLEPSEYLFDRASLSKILRSYYPDMAYLELYNAFIINKSYNVYLQNTNVEYLILHDDLASDMQNVSSSAQIRVQLAKNPDISFLKTIGKLSIYRFHGYNGLFVVDGDGKPSFTYKKMSATLYRVDIHNARKEFQLIFKESYDSRWHATIQKKVIDTHTLVFRYANEWKIDKMGSYSIDISL